MKAQDLRLGNLVLYSDEQILPVRIGLLDAINSGHTSAFKPVPLTEDWLVRFGFEKVNPHYLLRFPNSKNLISQHIGGQWSILWDDNKDILLAKVEFVHQLQNYYYATRLKELELKNG